MRFTSTLANVYTAHELARRLAGRAITVNAFDPGLMPETRLDRDYPAGVQRVYDRLAPLLVRLVPGVTGRYFAGRKQRRSSAESHDPGRAAELWATSKRLVAG